MNHDLVLAVLPESANEAISLKEIALVMGLEISSYSDKIRIQRRLARSLRALMKWGWLDCGRRQRGVGHKFWHNAHRRTTLAGRTESATIPPADCH